MGIGMSLPWLLVAARPGLAQRLPRPGRWMNVVRVVLGIMMLGSSLWLLSLLTVHIGSLPVITLGVLLILTLLLVTAPALPLANGTARRGISCSGGRSSRVCIRLRRRGFPPRSYPLATAQRAGHCPRAGGEQTGVRRRDRRLVRDL